MFNPFGKELSNISIEDIRKLKDRQVAEGQYIEYKSDYQSTEKTSHSIASFANSHGGWYIMGVKAVNNIPNEFNGFELNKFGNDIERIRDIARDHINPVPRLESHRIELDGGRGLLVVQIFESDEPPHITKDGKIYRRNGAGSDPVAENDRYAIDKLYEKADLIQRIERFCRNDITVSKTDAERGWLEIYIITYPLNTFEIPDFLNENQIEELHKFLNDSSTKGTEISGSVPFDTVYPSQFSLIFRQTSPEKVAHLGLSYNQYFDGSCKIIIPFPYLSIKSPGMPKTEVEEALYSKINSADLGLVKIIDGYNLLSTHMILMMKHIEYIKLKGYNGRILVFYRLQNTWRNILFLDSPVFKKQIESRGLPICLQNSGQHPIKITKETLMEDMPQLKLTEYLVRFSPLGYYFGIFSDTFALCIKDWIEKISKK